MKPAVKSIGLFSYKLTDIGFHWNEIRASVWGKERKGEAGGGGERSGDLYGTELIRRKRYMKHD